MSTLRCTDLIGAPALRDLTGYAAVLGRVALPTGRALGAERQPDSTAPATTYWAKQGLVVRSGARLKVVVPRAWRGRLAIGWGSPARPTQRLVVPGCEGGTAPGGWLAYAGGFWVKAPACVPLIVEAGHHRQRVHVGVGAACPGQDPPPQAP